MFLLFSFAGVGLERLISTIHPNPAWSIAYTGAKRIDDVELKHTVTVNSTDNAPYTIAVVYASEYDSSKLSELGQYEKTDSMKLHSGKTMAKMVGTFLPIGTKQRESI